MSVIFGTNNPETIDRIVLVRQIQLRDFSQFSSEMLERFTNRIESEFGINAHQKPQFDFSPIVKRIILYYQNPNQIHQPKPSEKLLRCERNLQIIAKIRYYQWITELKNTPKSEYNTVMEQIIRELKYWDKMYRDFLTALELPQPTVQEALIQLEHLVNEFKKNESSEQITQIENLKRNIIKKFTQHEINNAVKHITNTLDSFFKPQPKKK
ncbi:MAG: hypothetical protein LBE18_08815 [Planctomycetaceae bacterium]|nr:hypothetical protein [Planctomycetaceae bacterium]